MSSLPGCKYLSLVDANLLEQMLRSAAPYDTGALHDMTLVTEVFDDEVSKGFVVLIGAKGIQGRDPSKYAYYTEYKNSSKGWIKRTLEQWAALMESRYNIMNTFLDMEIEEEI